MVTPRNNEIGKRTDRGFMKYQMDLVEIGLETAEYKTLAMISLYKNQRFSDLLNNEKKFIVLRNVKVVPLNDKDSSYEKQYLIVNKNSIVFAWEE